MRRGTVNEYRALSAEKTVAGAVQENNQGSSQGRREEHVRLVHGAFNGASSQR